MIVTRQDIETMKSHGWNVNDKFMPEFYVRFLVTEARWNLGKWYEARIIEQAYLTPGKRWVLYVLKMVRDAESKVLAFYPDPVTCSVDLKLMGDGSITKGVEELARDRIQTRV